MSIYSEIAVERARAHAKHGPDSMESMRAADLLRLSILVEEIGEVGRAFNEIAVHCDLERALREARAELIQVAAMAAAWARRH